MEQIAHSVDPFVSLFGIFVLAVFVDRGDPVGRGRRHTGERRRMLPEVAAEPHRPDERVGGSEFSDDLVGRIGAVVVDEQYLLDSELVAIGRCLGGRQWGDFGDEGGKGRCPSIDGYDDADAVAPDFV